MDSSGSPDQLKAPHNGPSGLNRATAGLLGANLGIMSIWVFQYLTGVHDIPAQVSAAWGSTASIIGSILWSKYGGIGGE